MESIKNQLEETIQTPKFRDRYKALVEELFANPDIRAFLKENQIPREVARKSYNKLYEYVSGKAKIDQGLSSQNEGFEPVLIYENQQIDVIYKPTQDYLARQASASIAQRIQTIDMPKGIKKVRFADLDFDEGRLAALEYLVDFIAGYRDKQEGKGAYLFGSYGVGKTHLLGALAYDLAQRGFSSTLVHFPSLVVELKQALNDRTFTSKLDSLKKAPILMLDDLGGENLTAWVRDDILMTLLDYRMRQDLPTFFTSNLSFEDLEEHFKGTGVEDERKALRLMERVKFLSQEIRVAGSNRRRG